MAKTSNKFTLALLGMLLIVSITAGIMTQGYSENQSVYIATQWLRTSETYGYDGMEETIELLDVETAEASNSYYITLRFTSRNAGYGDRTGEMVATVLTEHTVEVLVSQGEIVSAITDGVYDELTGTMIETPSQVEEAEDIALEWLRNAPTFSFDGVPDSMRVIDTVIAESYPEQYFITITFECTHAGYGDRTGEALAQVITEHTAVVVVSAGEVRSAVIDEAWDEFNQHEKGVSEILSPDNAVNIVVEYLRENYTEAENLAIGDDWSVANLTPEGLLGSSTLQYSGDGWAITVSYPVVWKPTYTVEVENSSTGFTWSGTVDQSGTVTE
jgi:hypothetical protein